MKHKLIIFALLFCAVVSAQQNQEQENRLTYRSFSITPVSVFRSNFGSGFTGGLFTADLTFQKNKHLFSAAASLGSELNILGGSSSFSQYDLKYGRSFKLNRVMHVELHAGLGYFKFRNNSGGFFFSYSQAGFQKIEIEDSGGFNNPRLTFPVVAKLNFRTGPRFSLGLQATYSINSLVTIYSLGIVLQWNKRISKE